MTAGPSVETNIWQYYRTNYPGQVQVLGADVRDGTPLQLQGYVNTTGCTFPFLLKCFAGPPAGNFVDWYGQRDNFVVINKQGIVRYRAALTHPFGQGFQLNEIRGCVDSLVTLPGTGVEPSNGAKLSLTASPNPCRSQSDVALTLPRVEGDVRVRVLDLAGRTVQVLWDAAAPAGTKRLVWDTRDDQGHASAPGVYFVRADVSGRSVTTRVVVAR